jgi:hypothetical protein
MSGSPLCCAIRLVSYWRGHEVNQIVRFVGDDDAFGGYLLLNFGCGLCSDLFRTCLFRVFSIIAYSCCLIHLQLLLLVYKRGAQSKQTRSWRTIKQLAIFRVNGWKLQRTSQQQDSPEIIPNANKILLWNKLTKEQKSVAHEATETMISLGNLRHRRTKPTVPFLELCQPELKEHISPGYSQADV